VKSYSTETQSLYLLKDIELEPGNRKAIRVIFTAENHDSLAIDHKGMLIIFDLKQVSATLKRMRKS
jgi:hypothetical protein